MEEAATRVAPAAETKPAPGGSPRRSRFVTRSHATVTHTQRRTCRLGLGSRMGGRGNITPIL